MARPDYKKVKREVSEILSQFGINNPPINPVEIARGLGITVRFVSFNGEHSKVSGFYDPEDNAIFVNKDEHPLRQTFTIAHELGHAVMHRDWVKSDEYTLFMRDDYTDHGEAHEKEANAFAAHLLVPRSMLDRFQSLPPSDLSKLFAVSVPTVNNRISFEYGS